MYQGVRSITVHRVRPLEDMNEITYHMAAVMVSSVGENVTRMPSFSSPVQAAGGMKFEPGRAGVSSMGMGAGVSPADRCHSLPPTHFSLQYLTRAYQSAPNCQGPRRPLHWHVNCRHRRQQPNAPRRSCPPHGTAQQRWQGALRTRVLLLAFLGRLFC